MISPDLPHEVATADQPAIGARTVFLTGATGYIGVAVARALAERGHRVLGLVRRPSSAARLPSGVVPIEGDLAAPEQWLPHARGADAAIHLGYEYDESGREVPAVDRRAIGALLDARCGGRLAQVVYTSNAFLLGDHPAEVVTEGTPLPAGWLATRHRLAVEAAVLDRGGVAIRVGMVYGGLGGTLPQVFASLAAHGHAAPFDRRHNHWSLVQLADLAELYRRVVEQRAVGLFHGTDGAPMPASEVVAVSAAALGVAHAPPPAGDDSADDEHLARLSRDVVVVPARSRTLGWRPRWRSFRDGVHAAVADWRALRVSGLLLAGLCGAAGAAAAQTGRIVRSDTAYAVAVPGLVPEGIAYDARRGTLYVGSVALGRIYRIGADGRPAPLAGVEEPLGRVLGMRLDGRDALWVATVRRDTAGPARSALLELDPETGGIRRRIAPPDPTRGHLLNDLVPARNGDVFVTDTEAGAVYRLPRDGDSLEVWYRGPGAGLRGPNGIALAPDERTLYVAHAEGIVAVDVASRRGRDLRPPDGAALGGIDGLYATGRVLAGVQNGHGAERVIAVVLDRRGHDATCVRVLEQGHPAYDTPTTGALVGDTLLYLANSQLRAFLGATGGRASIRDTTVILRLPLGARDPERLCEGARSPDTAGYVQVNGIRMYYETHGSGTPVLLLHGGTTAGNTWRHQVPALAGRFRVIVPDLRGHGRTADGPDSLSYPLLADDVGVLLDSLGVSRADVVGWSMGGIVGLELALRHPARLGRLVLLGAGYNTDGLAGPFRERWRTVAPEDWAPEVRRYYEAHAPDPAHWAAFFEKLRHLVLTAPRYTPADLGGITTPTLVLAGRGEQVFQPEHLEGLARAIPGARLGWIDSATHFAHQEQPDAVNAAIVGFLAGAGPGAR